MWDMLYLLVHWTASFMCADGPSGLTVVNNKREFPSAKKKKNSTGLFFLLKKLVSLFPLPSVVKTVKPLVKKKKKTL